MSLRFDNMPSSAARSSTYHPDMPSKMMRVATFGDMLAVLERGEPLTIGPVPAGRLDVLALDLFRLSLVVQERADELAAVAKSAS